MNLTAKVLLKFVKVNFNRFFDKFESVIEGNKLRMEVEELPPVKVTNFPKKFEIEGKVDTGLEFPKELDVTVKNPQKFPKEITLSKESKGLPTEQAQQFYNLMGAIVRTLEKKEFKLGQKLPINASPKEWLNVRFTDGDTFLSHLVTAIQGVGVENVGIKDISDTQIDPATKDKQDDIVEGLVDVETEIQKLVGFEIGKFDSIDLIYVASGNGEGEIETAVYKLGVTMVATLTLTYNSDNEISSVVKT